MANLTIERLRSILHYAPETGVFTWLVAKSSHTPVGTIAGATCAAGYILIGVDGTRYYGHRLAWFYMTGAWPVRKVDHRDGIPSNNRWANLRQADDFQNARNSRAKGRTGAKGVSFCRQTKRWKAQIGYLGKTLNLGRFKSKNDAAAAYAAAAARLHGDFARLT